MTASLLPAHRMFCTFRLNGRLFGVDILDVKEVTAETSYTRVAHAPLEVMGLVNIRGYIFLALDLRRLLGMPPTTLTNESRLVLFKPAIGHVFGVMVDAIGDIQTADADRMESFRQEDQQDPLGGGPGPLDLIDCVCQLDSELLVVLNPRRFLTVIEQSLSATP